MKSMQRWNAAVCFQPPGLPISNVLALVMFFSMCLTLKRVHIEGVVCYRDHSD